MSRFLKNLTKPGENAQIPIVGISDDRKLGCIGLLCATALRLYLATIRLRWEGLDETLATHRERGVLIALWHRRLLLSSYVGRRYPVASIASRSRDGELIAQTLTRMGFVIVRGSTFEGAVSSLRALLNLPRDLMIAVTPDGPRGPVFHLQPGIILLAQTSKRVVVPLSWRATREFHLKSWDSFAIPAPFSKAFIRLGSPIDVNALPGRSEEKRAELERRLIAFEEETHL